MKVERKTVVLLELTEEEAQELQTHMSEVESPFSDVLWSELRKRISVEE